MHQKNIVDAFFCFSSLYPRLQFCNWSGSKPSLKKCWFEGLGVMLDPDVEMFAKGLSELRMYVSQQRKRVVPWNYVSDSSFRLGGGFEIFFAHVRRGFGSQPIIWRNKLILGQIPKHMVIDLKVLVRSFNCESRACYVGNPRECFISSSRK